MSRDAIIENLRRELAEPITAERQAVYILVEIRKLLERDAAEIGKLIKGRDICKFDGLRFFCNWALHADMTDGPVRNDLSFLGHVVKLLRAGHDLNRKEIERTQRLLSFGDARPEFLALVRYMKLNRAVPQVFSSPWWAAFLRQYVRVIQDCPMVLETPGPGGVKKASVTGHEILSGLPHKEDIESIFEISWRFECKDGGHFPMTQGLEIEKYIPDLFGRDGRISRSARWNSSRS